MPTPAHDSQGRQGQPPPVPLAALVAPAARVRLAGLAPLAWAALGTAAVLLLSACANPAADSGGTACGQLPGALQALKGMAALREMDDLPSAVSSQVAKPKKYPEGVLIELTKATASAAVLTALLRIKLAS